MKLSVFVTVLLPSVYAFVVPSQLPSTDWIRYNSASTRNYPGHVSASLTSPETAWSVTSFFQDILGTKPELGKIILTEPDHAEEDNQKRFMITQERKCMEGQLCSLLRIGGEHLSPKVAEHVKRLTHELEDMQANGRFGMNSASLAGRWKLLYSSAGSSKCPDVQGTVEEISYVSENYRISHTENGVLRIYKRSLARPSEKMEDDTANAGHLMWHGAGRGRKTATATATRRSARKSKQPLRKRLFFGWRG